MRILAISNLFPPESMGGYEECCADTVASLRSRGHKVSVLTSHFGLVQPEAIGADEGPWRSLIPVGFFGFPWVRFPRLFAVERHNVRAFRAAAAMLRPDVIHVWNMGGISKSLLSVANELAPVVTDVSDQWVIRGLRSDPVARWRARHPVVGRLAAAAAGIPLSASGCQPLGRVYFNSRYLRDQTAAAGFDVADAEVIYPGIDVEAYDHAVATSVPGQLRCCYVGRLHPDKGVTTACAGVAATRKNVTLDCYGSGQAAYEEELHRAYGEHPRIRFMGRVKRRDTPAIYANYDCLVFPSEWEEPFGLVMLEAAAAGRVIVGTAVGGSSEFLREGDTGLTYPAGDFKALGQRLDRLAADPGLARTLSTQAQALVRERFTLEGAVNRIEATLASAVDRDPLVRT